MVIGEDRAAQLFGELDRGAMAFELRAAVAENSKTFARTQMDDVVKSRVTEGVRNKLLNAEPVPFVQEGVRTATGRTSAGRGRIVDEVYGDITNVLVRRGTEAQNTLRMVSQSAPPIPGRASRLQSLTEFYGSRGGVATAAAVESAR